jgi:hypothetical protein
MNLSGAPVALLYLAKALSKLNVEVQVAYMQEGKLISEFEKNNIKVDNEINGVYDVVVYNTMLSMYLIEKINKIGKKNVLWIHESPTFYRYSEMLNYKNIKYKNFDKIYGVADFQVEEIKKSMVIIKIEYLFG